MGPACGLEAAHFIAKWLDVRNDRRLQAARWPILTLHPPSLTFCAEPAIMCTHTSPLLMCGGRLFCEDSSSCTRSATLNHFPKPGNLGELAALPCSCAVPALRFLAGVTSLPCHVPGSSCPPLAALAACGLHVCSHNLPQALRRVHAVAARRAGPADCAGRDHTYDI